MRKDAQGTCVSHKNSGLIRQGGVNLKYDSDLTRIITPLTAKQSECVYVCVCVCVSERERETHIKREKVFVGQSSSKYFKRDSMCTESVCSSLDLCFERQTLAYSLR